MQRKVKLGTMWFTQALNTNGSVKNLNCIFRSTFMKDGKDCKLHNDVERVFKEFHRSRKPIGYVCCDPSSVISLTDFELESQGEVQNYVEHEAKLQTASDIYLLS